MLEVSSYSYIIMGPGERGGVPIKRFSKYCLKQCSKDTVCLLAVEVAHRVRSEGAFTGGARLAE